MSIDDPVILYDAFAECDRSDQICDECRGFGCFVIVTDDDTGAVEDIEICDECNGTGWKRIGADGKIQT